MATYLIWAMAGFVLIIAELMTGTFYLLVLGATALIGAAIAWAGGEFWLQVVVSSAISLLGVFVVRKRLAARPRLAVSSNSLEIGQSVVFEAWVNETAQMARVRYRGSTWNARVEIPAVEGDILYIHNTANGVLQVGPQPS